MKSIQQPAEKASLHFERIEVSTFFPVLNLPPTFVRSTPRSQASTNSLPETRGVRSFRLCFSAGAKNGSSSRATKKFIPPSAARRRRRPQLARCAWSGFRRGVRTELALRCNAEFRTERLNTCFSENQASTALGESEHCSTGCKQAVNRNSTRWPVSQCREQRATLASDPRPQGLLTYRPVFFFWQRPCNP